MKSNLKPAYILSSAVLISMIKEHLSSEFETDGMTVRFTGNNVVVANITPKVQKGTSSFTAPVSSIDYNFEANNPDEFDDEYEEDDEDENDGDIIYEMVTKACTVEPRTASQIAAVTELARHDVDNALSSSDFAKVAPARENGHTVPMYMRTGTAHYDEFQSQERTRIINQVVKFKNRILAVVPGADEEGANRPDLVQQICDDIQSDHTLPLSMKDNLCEELRRDARGIFYAMAEGQDLYHAGNTWKRHRLTVV